VLVQISDPGSAEVSLDDLCETSRNSSEITSRSSKLTSSGSLRTSSYVIFVDLPGNNDEMLLVHGYNGAFDKVSKPVAMYLRSLDSRTPTKPLYGAWTWDASSLRGSVSAPSDATLERLIARGYLTKLTADSEEALFTTFVENMHKRTMAAAPQYIFMPTYDCNLRCPYCFQDKMRTDASLHHLITTMTPEVIDRIFRGIRKIESMLHNAVDVRKRKIGFFGGEPLLSSSRPAVKYIIESAQRLGGASFWAVTNGTELAAYEDLLSPELLSFLQITLDGPPEEHDKRRIYADGSGSFHLISRNITMALEKGVAVSVRVNVDRNNLAQLPAVADVLSAYGWSSNPLFSCYTAPIHAENDRTPRSSTMDSWELDDAQSQLQQKFPQMSAVTRPSARQKHAAQSIFSHRAEQLSVLRDSFCSAHSGMYIFDAFADIYACWERTGDASIRIGSIREDNSVWLNKANLDLWRTRTVVSNPICRKCRYALHCGGGCAVQAFGRTGKYHMNFCDGFASVFRTGVAEAYAAHESGAKLDMGPARVCDQ
jgi:uncharacterized protein